MILQALAFKVASHVVGCDRHYDTKAISEQAVCNGLVGKSQSIAWLEPVRCPAPLTAVRG
jgi:hypothetical protein